MENEAPIFIVGCPRSGTSLLRDLLRSHPHLTIPAESHFIPPFYRGYGNPRSRREAVRLARRILSIHWIREWKLDVQADAFGEDRTFAAVVSRLFGEYARSQHKERWGDKTPHYVTEIPILREIFPACRIIHIYRDGRDVALSWLRVGFQPRNLYTAARLWRRYVTAGRAAGRDLPPETCTEVRYETLVADPEATLRQICAFVGEPFDPAVLQIDYMERVWRHHFFGRPIPRNMVSRTEIVAGNTNKWKQAMPVADRILFESVAGDLLASLGYEIEGLARPVPRLEELRWKAHHRFRWLVHRLNTVESRAMLQTDMQMRWARIRSRFRSALQ